MNRREFLQLLGRGTLGLAATGIPLESLAKTQSKTLRIDRSAFQIQNGVLSQTRKGDGQIKLGILNDLHAHKQNSRYFTDQLNKEGVDAFFLGGDLSHSFGDYEGSKDDYKEIIDVVEPIASTGKLILSIPGNHEQKAAYGKALEHLSARYPNVIDMEKVPVADLDGLTIIALGGNDNARFNVPRGYLLDEKDFEKLGELATQHQKDKPILIATHVPQKYNTRKGLDVIANGINVGSVDLARIRKAIGSKFAVSGHIHEAYGIITPDEQQLRQGEFSSKLDFNPGAVYDHTGKNLRPAAGILEFKGNKARAYILNR